MSAEELSSCEPPVAECSAEGVEEPLPLVGEGHPGNETLVVSSFNYFFLGVANAFTYSQVYTQTKHIRSIIHNSIAMNPLKPYTLTGFGPGSSVPEADAISTATAY
jgi:hypothetical protein